ncbi:MAG TPA: serine/threonine-protein kinase [Ilumatobacteraceae bacterium]|nr:serine/threonine-protein kinase [Ilumatobacteraceae bacterium]
MSTAAPPPTVIAHRYELKRMLAQGGMAEVWLAHDLTLDRKVAVKWLKPSLATDEVVAERFRREAIAAASLNHPNIVAVHDVFEQDGRQAVVMQLVEGKSLRQVLDTQKRLSPELTCHIGTCVAAALDHAHAAGFVHRDVKPGNIMMTSDGRVLLTDFGIAKGLQSVEEDLTSDNIMMGTAKYLSPEQVRGKKLDGRADLYSLGLVLYECLAGRVPFLGETDADTALARLQRDPTDLSRLRATLPTKLVVVIHQLLARNPAQRPASGSVLVSTLRDAAKEGPPPIDPTPYGPEATPPGARRLRRAPSDVAGQASDRVRTTPGAPGPSNIASIPGEVGHSGTTPIVARSGPTAFDELPAHRDLTPPGGARAGGKPARGLTQEWKPAFAVVAALVVAAIVVGALVWANLEFGAEESVASTPAVAVDDSVGVSDTAPVALGSAIATLTAYDPDGDGVENDADAVLATADADPGTAWRTVCYSDRFLGGKRGVGLVVTFDAPLQQAITVDVMSAPYQVAFYATDAAAIPATIDDWGSELGTTQFAAEAGTVTSPVPPAPVRHVFIALEELGEDAGCTADNPYRGRLGEIAIAD